MHMRIAQKFDRDTTTLLCSWGKCIATHDIVRDFFNSIANDVGFYISHKQIHVPLAPSFKSLQQWMDILLTINDIYILTNIHCWPDSCKSCFTSCFFSRNGHNNYSTSKGCVISWLTPWGWVYLSCNRNIWMLH
jgi:hypothetical protein